MKRAVIRKLVLLLILGVLLAVGGVFVREGMMRQTVRRGYKDYNQEVFFEGVHGLWFTSEERKFEILYQARARAWSGEF